MNIMEKATELHQQGYNCAQAVLCACGEYTGMEEKAALAISGGFGGGLRSGEVCGAVSGALMAIGICNPYNDCSNEIAKAKIAELAKKLCADFNEEFGCIRCEDLKSGKRSCKELIEYAAAKAEEIINNNK